MTDSICYCHLEPLNLRYLGPEPATILDVGATRYALTSSPLRAEADALLFLRRHEPDQSWHILLEERASSLPAALCLLLRWELRRALIGHHHDLPPVHDPSYGNVQLTLVQELLAIGGSTPAHEIAIDGLTPLGEVMASVSPSSDTPALVHALLAAGSPRPYRLDSSESPLMIAAAAGHEEGLCLLLDAWGPDKESDWGAMLLETAVQGGHEGVVAVLLARGVDPDVGRGAMRSTALNCAAHAGHEAIVRHLLAAGADPGRIETPETLPPAMATLLATVAPDRNDRAEP